MKWLEWGGQGVKWEGQGGVEGCEVGGGGWSGRGQGVKWEGQGGVEGGRV